MDIAHKLYKKKNKYKHSSSLAEVTEKTITNIVAEVTDKHLVFELTKLHQLSSQT